MFTAGTVPHCKQVFVPFWLGTGKIANLFYTVCTVPIWYRSHIFPARESLVTGIPAGDGKNRWPFLQCMYMKIHSTFLLHFPAWCFFSYLKFPHSPCDMRVFNLVSNSILLTPPYLESVYVNSFKILYLVFLKKTTKISSTQFHYV